MSNTTTHKPSLWQRHQVFERNSIILVIGILIAVSIGGLVEVLPLFYLKSTIEKVDGEIMGRVDFEDRGIIHQ